MSAQYKFTFNSIEITNPLDWDEINENIKFDDALKLRYSVKENSFTFSDEGYKYLLNLYDTQFCGEVEVKIFKDAKQNGSFTESYSGIIKVRDVEFDKNYCIATTKINDNSYFSLVNNNKSIKYLLAAGKSKNGVNITIPDTTFVFFGSPCEGTFNPHLFRNFYTAYDCLKTIIAHITDDRVEFDSPYFGVGGEKEFLYVANGLMLRIKGWTASNPTSGVSSTFADIFHELDVKFNLGITIDTSGLKPKLIVDKYENFFDNTLSLTINEPPVFRLSTFVQKLYGIVGLGGDAMQDYACPNDGNFPIETVLYGFKKEELIISGQCNIDRKLDLTANWIVDHNIIFQVLKGSTTYDDNIFLFDCEVVDGDVTVKLKDLFNNGEIYWNGDLRNSEVMRRWASLLPGDANAWYAQATSRFKAYSKGQPLIYDIEPLTHYIGLPDDYNVGFDPDNLYGNGTPQGTPVPTADSRVTFVQDGTYKYLFRIGKVYITASDHNLALPFHVTIALKVYDSGGTLKASYPQSIEWSLPTETFDLYYEVPAIATDYMVIGVVADEYLGAGRVPISDCYLEQTNTPVLSGVVQSAPTNLIATKRIYCETPLSFTDYSTMKNNPKSYIEIVKDGIRYRGDLAESRYDEVKGNIELTLSERRQ